MKAAIVDPSVRGGVGIQELFSDWNASKESPIPKPFHEEFQYHFAFKKTLPGCHREPVLQRTD
jgi:hypothetical protein